MQKDVQNPANSNIFNEVSVILSEIGIASSQNVTQSLPLLGKGGLADSLTAARLVAEVEKRFGVDITCNDLDLECLQNVGTLVEFIGSNVSVNPRESSQETVVGRHLTLDCSRCPAAILENLEFIGNLLRGIAQAADVTIVKEIYHEYTPYGITGLAIVSESHISVHTWPEYDYLGVDAFSCNEIDAQAVRAVILKEFPDAHIVEKYFERKAVVNF